jgi:hypothetical protein
VIQLVGFGKGQQKGTLIRPQSLNLFARIRFSLYRTWSPLSPNLIPGLPCLRKENPSTESSHVLSNNSTN